MVHKGLGSDKAISRSQPGDLRSTSFLPPRWPTGFLQTPTGEIRLIRFEYCEVDFDREQHLSSAVSSGERRDKVIKILRPMKASRSNLWPASHLVTQNVCKDLMTLKLHIMYFFSTSVAVFRSDSWNPDEMSPSRWAALLRACQQYHWGDCSGGLPYGFHSSVPFRGNH